ncbi:NADPH-dependent F420 reductase [Citricoccus sp. GCM10030269]|uniref:NADPH-dependent F420 reductase n=1 Tax=Citricoccus sp. GCM10030269 TaxID=3273388 RepID=UPI0036201AF4
MTTTAASIRTIGILGAGRVGAAVARRAVAVGFEVCIATAKPAREIEPTLRRVVPGARAVEPTEITETDLTVVAIPLRNYRELEPTLFDGQTVVDAMNYWTATDGELAAFDRDHRTTSEIVQEHLAGARLVKTLNHIGYHDLESDHRHPGAPDRRALAVAGDHVDTCQEAAWFVEQLGFDAVQAGPLAAGRILEPGTEIFTGRHSAERMRSLVAQACANVSA